PSPFRPAFRPTPRVSSPSQLSGPSPFQPNHHIRITRPNPNSSFPKPHNPIPTLPFPRQIPTFFNRPIRQDPFGHQVKYHFLIILFASHFFPNHAGKGT